MNRFNDIKWNVLFMLNEVTLHKLLAVPIFFFISIDVVRYLKPQSISVTAL